MLSFALAICFWSMAARQAGADPMLATFAAICRVESGGDPHAVGDAGRSVGIAQITPAVIADANRIMGRPNYNLADRLDPVKSFEIFRLYVRHYAPAGGPEQWSRTWNGGPKGRFKAATVPYWQKINRQMQRQFPPYRNPIIPPRNN